MITHVRYWLGAAEAVPALALAWALVFVAPFRWTARYFGGAMAPLSSSRPPEQQQIAKAQHVAMRLERVAAHLPWRTTCLVRAIAGALLLRRRGIASIIRLGVNRSGDQLEAHAWLLVGDTIVLGGANSLDFKPLADLRGKS